MAIITLAGVALSWASADDKEIAKQITERLKREQDLGNLSDFDINLKVAEGYVLLKGHVSSPEQQKLALEAAREAKGVKRVVSDLDVQQDLSAVEAPERADSRPAIRNKSNDGEVAAAIAQSLRSLRDDGDLRGFRINFDVADGSVVMKGTVASQEQRDLAMQVARNTRGVERVIDQLLVKKAPAARSDEPQTAAFKAATSADPEIAEQVCSGLRRRKETGDLSGFSIDLTVENGAVILTGHVSNPEQRQLAEEIAKSTKGVCEVVNNLVVTESWKPERSVQETPEAVAEEPQTLAVRTKTDRSLKQGSQDSQAETAVVSPVEPTNDSQVTQQIARELQRQRSLGILKEFKIRVSVEDGIAILDGRVTSAKQREIALDLVRKTEGVREAVDHLIVVESQTMPQPQEDADRDLQMAAAEAAPDAEEKTVSDAEIARQIAGTLKRQKQAGALKGFRIDLNVEDGVATLSGQVSSEKQRQMAADAAKSTEGVRGVVNNLAVRQRQPEGVTPDESKPAKDSDAQAEKVASESGPTARERKVSDQEIARQVAAALGRQKELGGLKGFNIDVAVQNGVVQFEGHVSSADQRDLALDIAKHANGVRDVVSHLAIQDHPPANENAVAEAPRRAGLLNAVSRFLRRDTGRSAAANADRDANTTFASAEMTEGIEARTANFEPTPAESTGVVENAIYRPEEPTAADPGQVVDDQQIGEELMRRLHTAKREGNLRGFGIDVRVVGGSIYLAGRVASKEQQELALDIARYIPGAREVVNELTVAQTQIPEPERREAQMIANELGQRLQAEEALGNLRNCDFDVKVDGGDVWLTGEVETADQAQLAEETARRIPGVQRVVSALKTATPASVANEQFTATANTAPDTAIVPEATLANAAFPTPATPIDAGPASGASTSRQPLVNQLDRMPISSSVPSAGIERSAQAASIPQAAQGANIGLTALEQNSEARLTPPAQTAVGGSRFAPAAPLASSTGPMVARQAAQATVRPLMPQASPMAAYPMPGYVAYPAVQPAANYYAVANQTPRPLGAARMAAYAGGAVLAAPFVAVGQAAGAMPPHLPGQGQAVVPARYDHPSLPGYAWPSYAAHPNYGALTYPKQYSPTAWPYIGPFYPYPQVPLGWRRVVLKWDDGWWQLNFKSK